MRASELGPGAARRRSTVVAIVLALSVLAGPAATAAGPVLPPWREGIPPRPTARITVGDAPVAVQLALSPAAQSLGLGHRADLPPGTGMLFVYADPVVQTFWMKGMRFCLDIVWIEGGTVVGAAERFCPSPAGTADADLPRVQSPRPVRYVLEVPAGWLADHGLGPGSPVGIPPAVAGSA